MLAFTHEKNSPTKAKIQSFLNPIDINEILIPAFIHRLGTYSVWKQSKGKRRVSCFFQSKMPSIVLGWSFNERLTKHTWKNWIVRPSYWIPSNMWTSLSQQRGFQQRVIWIQLCFQYIVMKQNFQSFFWNCGIWKTFFWFLLSLYS